jgi:uncharacterized protein YtpQ (UPF0354 family)
MIMIIMRWGTRKKRERQEPLWYRAELAEAYSWVAMHGSTGLSSRGRLRPIALFNTDRIKNSIRNDLARGTHFY